MVEQVFDGGDVLVLQALGDAWADALDELQGRFQSQWHIRDAISEASGVSPSPRRGLHRNQNEEEADGCPGLHPGIFSAVPGGTVPGAHEYPGLTSWATFSRPCGTVIWTDRFSPDSEVATVAFAQFPQNGRDVKPPIGPRQVEIPGANYLRLGNSQPELPGGNCVPA